MTGKVITDYFNAFKDIKSDTMLLLKTDWNGGLDKFKGFMDRNDLSKYIEFGSGDEYKSNLPYDSFPLRINMDKIISIKNLEALVHPAYSRENHLYIVKFNAGIDVKNGIVGDDSTYKYDYTIKIIDGKVAKVFLNGVEREVKIEKSDSDKEKGNDLDKNSKDIQ